MQEHIQKLIASYIPMSEQGFLTLLCLTKPNHGYNIMQKVLSQTDGRVSMGPSTVYTVLYKMEQDGLIVVAQEVERRKVYEITQIGIRVLEAETERLKNLSAYAEKSLREIDVLVSNV